MEKNNTKQSQKQPGKVKFATLFMQNEYETIFVGNSKFAGHIKRRLRAELRAGEGLVMIVKNRV